MYTPSIIRTVTQLIAIALAISTSVLYAQDSDEIPAPPREFRGLWIATVNNIDWPSKPGLTSEQQQTELLKIYDLAKSLNFNAIVFQVRPCCDSFYDSQLEPWSGYLTGKQGKPPEPYYDPLTFAIEEAHKRGMELHAWFNPYRAAANKTTENAPAHVAKKMPAMVRQYGDQLWLDPTEKEVQDYSIAVIMDVVSRYDIDAVHFDDYFYPYKVRNAQGTSVDFPDDAAWDKYKANGGRLQRDDWRREHVDTFIKTLSEEIKKTKPTMRFGISPFGIWRPGNPVGVSGLDAYSELYADSRKWLKVGWVDYLAPQLYWTISSPRQSYPVLLKWWTEQNIKQRHIWPGNFTSKISEDETWTAQEIVQQVDATRKTVGATGNIHFSARALLTNKGGICEALKSGAYQSPALVPASPWVDRALPVPPRAKANRGTDGSIVLSWLPSTDTDTFLYAIYAFVNGAWRMDLVPATTKAYAINAAAVAAPTNIAISAIDRAGNESARSIVKTTDLAASQ